jgi:hypothetical protein
MASEIPALMAESWNEVKARAAAAIVKKTNISADFVKIALQPQGVPLSIGLIDTNGFGPIVNVPPFAEGLQVTAARRARLVDPSPRQIIAQ